MTPRSDQSGFTLVELMLAFSILLIGMTGVISLFSAGLTLERQGTLAQDSGLVLDELMPRVIESLRKQIVDGTEGTLSVPRTAVPDWPGLDYEVEAQAITGEPISNGFLVKVTVISQSSGGDRRTSMGWLPVALVSTYEERVRRLSDSK